MTDLEKKARRKAKTTAKHLVLMEWCDGLLKKEVENELRRVVKDSSLPTTMRFRAKSLLERLF